MSRVKEKSSMIKLVWKDSEALNLAAAYYFTKRCNESIATKGFFSVALSGGSTPKQLYEILSTPEFSRNIDWKKVLIFWGDERFVPHNHDDSNYKMVKEALLDKIKIPKKNIFAVPVNGWPQDCAVAYEQTIKATLGRNVAFDLILLGMGDDGHTASLFPGTQILDEHKQLVKEVWVDSKQTWRISFTYSLINRGKEIMFLISGENKAPVLKKIFSNRKLKTPYPVQNINPQTGNIIWMLDEAAAFK